MPTFTYDRVKSEAITVTLTRICKVNKGIYANYSCKDARIHNASVCNTSMIVNIHLAIGRRDS